MEETVRFGEEFAQLSFTIAAVREPDAPICYASDTFLEMTGYSARDILGRNCRILQGKQACHSAFHKLSMSFATVHTSCTALQVRALRASR